MDANFWNGRYGEEGLAYGESPNEFLVKSIENLQRSGLIPPSPRILCIAEGEGRNAFYLARIFPDATIVAVDYSEVAIRKILAKSLELGFAIDAIHADLADYDLSKHGPFDIVVSIFAHLPSSLSAAVHANLANIIPAKGHFIIEGYSESNIGRGTGGPQHSSLCYKKDLLLQQLYDHFEVVECDEEEREVNEGVSSFMLGCI